MCGGDGRPRGGKRGCRWRSFPYHLWACCSSCSWRAYLGFCSALAGMWFQGRELYFEEPETKKNAGGVEK